MIEASQITAGYGGVPVIHDVSLSVEPGELVVLLGANGAGKSTTLLTLSGCIPLDSGVVRIDGSETTSPMHRRARRGLSLVPERRSIAFGLTVADNLRIARGDTDVAYETFPELVPLRRRRAGLLSGGEQQILALARALVRKPRVLLADELSLGLAPMVVQRLLGTIREAADGGLAVLLVEQHVGQVLSIADRAYVLQRGAVVLSGTASEVRERLPEVEAAYLGG